MRKSLLALAAAPALALERIGNLIRLVNHPPTMSIRVARASGGASHVIDQGDGTGVVVTTAGSGGSCTMGRGAPAGAAAAGSLAGLAGLAFAARRRRKAKPSPLVGR